MAQTDEHIFFYGSLMSSFDKQRQLGVEEHLELVRECEVLGSLIDLGDYPGLILGNALVKGELFKIKNKAVLQHLDDFEGFYPDNKSGSFYVRTKVRVFTASSITFDDANKQLVPSHVEEVWAYFFNQDYSNKQVIPSGDWKAYLSLKGYT